MAESLPSRLRGVFFDAGDTLLSPYPSFEGRFIQVAQAHGASFEEAAVEAAFADGLRQAVWPADPVDPATQEAFWTGFYRDILRRLGHAGDVEELARTMCRAFSDPSAFRIYPDVREGLEALRARGLVLGVVSNFEPWLRKVLELEGIAEFFTSVAISGELGVAKPHPAIFHAALDAAGLRPAGTVHVGDQPVSDVEGARSVGMTPVLIDRFGRGTAADAPRVRDLTELVELLA